MPKKKNEIKLPEGCTPDMIAAWKEKYGENKLRITTLPKDEFSEDGLEVVLRVPTRRIVDIYMNQIDKSFKRGSEILVKNCCLFNQEQVLTDDDYFYTCATAIGELIPIRKAIIKNL